MNKQAPFAREDVVEAYLDSLLTDPDEVKAEVKPKPQAAVEVDDPSARTARLLEQAANQIAKEAMASPVPEGFSPKALSSKPVLSEPKTPESKPSVLAAAPKPKSIPTALADAPPVKRQVNLDTLTVARESTKVEEPALPKNESTKVNEAEITPDEVVEEEITTPPPPTHTALQDSLEFEFQALFFEVAGLTLAVPLTTLGGIHQIDKVGPLFGKPPWFMGVMLHREAKLNVVDTACWVMPEKYDENLAESLNYRYLIMLGDSFWGLASEKLVNTVNLTKDDVKWRESTGKRPWLAGMVKEKMCALIDVNELISMLNKGLGSNDQTP